MNFTVDQSVLSLLATRAKSIVPSKPHTPVLGCAVLKAHANGLTVIAADREVAYQGEHTADVARPGEAAISADTLLSAAAKSVRPGPVTVAKLDNGRVEFRQGRDKFTLEAFDAADHPGVPPMDGGETMTVDVADLRRVLRQGGVSMGAEGEPHGFGAIKPEVVDGVLRIVSSDGNRLSYAECPMSGRLGGGATSTIPRRVVEEVSSMLDSIAGSVDIVMSARAIMVCTANTRLVARLSEMEFPNYRDVLPGAPKRRCTVVREEAIDAIKRAATFSSVGTTQILRVEFSATGVVMSGRKLDAGSSRVEMDAEMDGAPLSTGFNARILLDALGVMSGEKVVFEMGDALSPFVLRDVGDERCYFLAMPIRFD